MQNISTILIVDDEPLNIKLVKLYLEDLPYTTLSASSSHDAFILLESNPNIDLILLDRMLPEMDGIEFVKKIKRDPNLQNIPVIMQSAAAEQSKIDESLDAGICRYITKPYDAEDLIKVIDSISL